MVLNNLWDSLWDSLRRYFGFRVIKTAAAAMAAIFTATLLDVTNPTTAGILAILGVETTRWRGLRVAFSKFAAALFGLFLASVLFWLFGFHIWVLSVYILLAFPMLVRFGLNAGTVTGAMVVFQLFARHELSLHALVGVISLLIIGLGWATVLNMIYMPNETKKLEALRNVTEENFSAIFAGMADYLRNPETLWAGEEVIRAENAIEQGIATSQRSRENRLIPQDEPWEQYFLMRREQMDSIKLMMASVAFVSSKVPQAEMIARLFDQLKLDVKSDYYEGETERRLDQLEKSFREMPLPRTRDEFETRSALLQLNRELRRCLSIAKRSKKQKSASVPAII